MWSLEPRSPQARVIAALACAAAVALLVLLQELGLRLRREEQRAWWAGNGRDLLNAVGFAAVAGALRAYGFPLPAALVLGATTVLAAFGIWVFAELRLPRRARRALALVAALAVTSPVLLFPADVLRGLSRVAAVLFPTG